MGHGNGVIEKEGMN